MRDLSKLKLCFLAGTLTQGGAERQLFYILQALCQVGATPRLLSLSQGDFWEEKIKALGMDVTCVGDGGSRLKHLFRIVKEARKDLPDALQSQHFFTNAYVSIAARLLHVSGIGAMRSNGISEVNECGKIRGWLNLRLPGMIAANSELAIEYAVSTGVPPSRMYFLPNVVDTDRFKPSSLMHRQITLIAVGRLVKLKRFDRFISILSRLRKNFKLDVRGLIVGRTCPEQNLRPQLEEQARSLGLMPDALEFRGSVSDMPPVYREAAICVLTSEFEGTPNVLLEAMASGLPVVATKVGGVPGIVKQGCNGFLRKPEDRDGLVADTVELVRNCALRTEMGHRARAFVEERHNLQRLPTYLSALYQRALPARHQATARVTARVSI